ncbi:GSCFA domain-containing protein [Roseovarius sp. S4756]|uniref:GSCFA domain-containing protein n=1 Tax=Roseovarius maritimus TaxID=3342637 RepID=UPI0037273A96
MTSPYQGLPSRAFWRTAVTNRAPTEPGDIYHPKFGVNPSDRIVTAGSCFAQHIGRALKEAQCTVIDTELAPRAISDTVATRFGYRMYSARYGNIYTVRQLAQLLNEMRGKVSPSDPVWQCGNTYFDAQRPAVEPNGLVSETLVLEHRAAHLKRAFMAFKQADVFVFTLGLTEAWVNRSDGTVYPTAPGTIAGEFDPARFAFKNFGYAEILEDFRYVRHVLHKLNKNMRFILTVSPVPLAATATSQHVEVASSYSKSTLRAVCGELFETYEDIDYFPSYEIITSQNSRGVYYDANKRTISPLGIQTAMNLFLRAHELDRKPAALSEVDMATSERSSQRTAEEVQCEEALLEAFAR